MPIPSIADLTLPLLKIAASGETSIDDAAEALGHEFGLTEEEKVEMLPSGLQGRFPNRVRWAKVELGMAKLVENTRSKHFRATERGVHLLEQNPGRLDYKYLMQFDEYRTKIEKGRGKASKYTSPSELKEPISKQTETDPDEQIELTYQELTAALAQDLLDRVVAEPPEFFEKMIVRLMLAMGYGGSREEAGRHLGRSGDEGVDGVIDEDALGLDVVYLQAKRYQQSRTIGRPDVQAFVGSLVGHGANKGVFVTTASFSEHAIDYARAVPQRVILIDGEELTRLMIRHGVGVRTIKTIDIKKIDEEFFTEPTPY